MFSYKVYAAFERRVLNRFSPNPQQLIIDALSLQHTTVRVVSEAAGERGRGTSRHWVSMRFVWTVVYLTITFIQNLCCCFFVTKWVRKIVPVLGDVYHIRIRFALFSFSSLLTLLQTEWSDFQSASSVPWSWQLITWQLSSKTGCCKN